MVLPESRDVGRAGGVSRASAHIRAALNLGCSRTEVREVLIQTCTFAGFAKSTKLIRWPKISLMNWIPQWCRIVLRRQK